MDDLVQFKVGLVSRGNGIVDVDAGIESPVGQAHQKPSALGDQSHPAPRPIFHVHD